MSVAPQKLNQKLKRLSARSLIQKKVRGERIVSLTCYDYSTARLLDAAGVDILLVGDSLAMTVLGHADTLSVTMEEMLHHVKAVSRGVNHGMVVADMPFMSYQVDVSSAVMNAGRFLKEGGAAAVKLEGASPVVLAATQQMVDIGIPVMGHLGYTPQSIHTQGRYRVQGRQLDEAEKILLDAERLQAAGAFALVLEMVPVELASLITARLSIPTIGIGAGNGCDGQVLVIDDLIGRYNELQPRFARRYLDFSTLLTEAIDAFRDDIQQRRFPDNDTEAFRFPEDLLNDLHATLGGLPTAPDLRP